MSTLNQAYDLDIFKKNSRWKKLKTQGKTQYLKEKTQHFGKFIAIRRPKIVLMDIKL